MYFITIPFSTFFSEVTCNPDYSSGNVTNGDVKCSDKNNFNSVCSFSCKDGYDVTGTANLTCTDKGTWDGDEPTCVGRDSQVKFHR